MAGKAMSTKPAAAVPKAAPCCSCSGGEALQEKNGGQAGLRHKDAVAPQAVIRKEQCGVSPLIQEAIMEQRAYRISHISLAAGLACARVYTTGCWVGYALLGQEVFQAANPPPFRCPRV